MKRIVFLCVRGRTTRVNVSNSADEERIQVLLENVGLLCQRRMAAYSLDSEERRHLPLR